VFLQGIGVHIQGCMVVLPRTLLFCDYHFKVYDFRNMCIFVIFFLLFVRL